MRAPQVGDVWEFSGILWTLTKLVYAGDCQETLHDVAKDHWHVISSTHGRTYSLLGLESRPGWKLISTTSSVPLPATVGATPNIVAPGHNAMPAPMMPVPLPKKKRFWVSMDNKNWARYDLLNHGDPIESYKYRKEL